MKISARCPTALLTYLFQLIKSLEKAEKRHFKLYINRSSGNEDLKIVRLFDALDKLDEYDEKSLLKKLPGTEKRQLYNLKTHLYKQITGQPSPSEKYRQPGSPAQRAI